MERSRWFHLTKAPKGQSIVIIAVALVVMVTMAALILDGGQLYMNRRAAQAAADAAAIAGASEMCKTKNVNNGIVMAENYAMTENGMTDATAWVENNTTFSENKVYSELVVEVTMSADSFFAKIFGVEENTVKATAGAVCGPPAGKGLLPIAWFCQPPWNNPADIETFENGYCEFAALDWFTQMKPLLDHYGGDVLIPGYDDYFDNVDFTGKKGTLLDKHIYVILNDSTTCPPDGTLNNPCDFNGDLRVDAIGAGNRGWLELDGDTGGGASTIADWILEGYDGYLQPHMWLPGQPGVANNNFGNLGDVALERKVVLVPVFNVYCQKPALGTACEQFAHNTTVNSFAVPDTDGVCMYPEYPKKNTDYYHIVGFMEFMITCVDAGGGQGQGACPGHEAAVKSGSIAANDKTVEGYFITGYPIEDAEVDFDGIDMGVYVVSLTR